MNPGMAVSREELTTEVRGVLAETLGIPLRQVSVDASLEDGLALDSLKMIEINVALEARFGVPMLDFTNEDETRIRNVRDLVTFVRSRLDTAGAP